MENSQRMVVIVGASGERRMTQRELLERMATGDIQVVNKTEPDQAADKRLLMESAAEILTRDIYQDNLREPSVKNKIRHPAEAGMRRQWWK